MKAANGVHRYEQPPVPLPVAVRLLRRSLERLPTDQAACLPDNWRILRLEVPLAAAGPQVKTLLNWLTCQRLFPRALFAARDGSLLVAGAGAAHVHRTGASPEPLLPQLGLAHENIRYIGGARFDGDVSGSEWALFGKSYWMLPRVEIAVQPVVNVSTGSAEGSEASSTPGTPVVGAQQAEGRMLHNAVLALQLRWCEDSEQSLEVEREKALQALDLLRPIEPSGKRAAVVASRCDTVSREDFEARVREALDAFAQKKLSKVVLARRMLLNLVWREDAPELMRQVVGASYKRHYLFLLEPQEGTAFISLSPERLCKVRGRDVWTEAVAGTWPITEFQKIGEAALLASSAKHSSEHQMVVDYICKLLDDIASHVKVCDTHILKLKHLVHIKQSYHALAKQGPSGDPFNLATFFCERMSPTPAVCGLPTEDARNFINQAEPWDRGFYAAPCGVLSAESCELIVALRSALLTEGRKLHVYAGAGVVEGSDPSEEFEEISLKMRQFTEAFANAEPCSVPKLMQLPNLNTLWATVIVEELVRLNVCNFVICPGSRSTPLVVAVARHQQTRHVVNHDERSGGFYALGWAKGINEVVAVIVTSGTAVANLLPAAVEAAQAQVPLLLLTADRPAELRDTGANQTIHQPGIFGCYTRWAKDFPAPSCEYSLMALLGDIDLAVAHSKGQLNFHPGPVHLNFCFRENLAPDGGPVRGAPGKSSQWDKAYVDFRAMHRWASSPEPRSRYIRPEAKLPEGPVLEELVALAQRGARILILVGTLKTPEEVLLSEDIASRLGAAVFADITSGLRQRPSAVHCSDQLLISELLASHLLQLDAIVQLGGPMTSARHNGAVKAGAPLYVRVAPAPVRMDQDHVVTHHLPCSLAALANALAEASLVPRPPSAFWKRLSSVAAGRIERSLDNNFNEPMVAQAVSRLLGTSARLLISSSMPIRDLDFFSKAYSEVWQAPIQPAMANRGASGIDGVISTAAGICAGCEVPCTLVIGDVASIQDINAFQLLGGSQAPPLTVVLINNGGGGIFSFLPISKHKDVMSPFFNEPHEADFQSICNAFNVPHVLCNSLQDFEAAYVTSQSQKTGCVIEVQPALNFEENVMLHKQIGQDVARAVRDELVSQVKISWCQGGKAEGRNVLVLLHGWMGQKADWKLVSQILMEEGCSILALDLPGHGDTQVADGSWEASALYSMPLLIEVLKQILDQLQLQKVIMVGYSLGGRVAMGFADSYPERCAALMVLSANPGVLTEEERHQRWLLDQRHAKQLTQQTFEAFLDSWYAAPLWAGLKERRPDVYSQMLEKRRQTRPHLAAHSLLGLSLASQPNFRPHLGQHVPFWYVFGELDSKFAEIGKDLAACSSKVHSLPCGHAVVEECPREVADLLLSLVKQLPSPSAPKAKVLQLTAAWTEPIQLLLKAPLLLSRGDLMPQRSGVLLVLQAQVDGAKMAGLGEVTPLPLFHKETLDEAESQLNYILAQWNSRPPKVPFDLGRLDGTLTKWLDQQCTGNLLPSVRAGLEMALLHLLRRAPEGWRRPQRSDVSINSLLARDEDLAADTALVAKFKVGKEPLEDAERTNQLAKLLLEKRPQARLRLDANRSWSLEQAASFISNLDEQALQITEYLEEPVQQSPQLLQHWEVLSEKTERRLAFAVDESLTEGIVSTKDLESCKAPIKALVLKPSLQGLEQTAAMAKWADEHGAVAVLSSAFESGVALCHFALLASMLAPCWAEDVAQGFGTFTRLSEDVLEPPFADLVSVGHKGWQVNIGSCQEALDRSVEALVAARQGTDLVDGPSLAKKDLRFLAERSASAAAQCDYSLVEISEECPSAYGFDWQLYHEQLYLARSAVFSGDRQQSQSAVLQLLDAVTRRFWFAFECPLAVASTYFSLAQNFAFQGRLRRALAFIHMGFIFIRDKGFNECTPWPVQGWDMLLAGRNLVAKVRELDDESVVPTPPEFRLPKHRVAIASICAYGETEPVRLIGCENHRVYAELHGYDLYQVTDKSQIQANFASQMDVQDGKHKPFFWKVNVVKNILEQRPRYDWILWIDCDAFFMDPGRTIDSVIHMYSANTTAASRLGPRRFGEDLQKQALRQRVEGSPGPEGSPAEVSLIVATDSSGINNGVWLMKNTAWSHDFLVRWWHSEILQGPGENHNCSDQSTMQHQLLYENSMTIDDSWDSVEAPIWVPQVRVAAQEHLQSFHAATAATVASREWQEGDFIKHHPGCHYYKPPCQQLYLEAHENFLRKLQAMR